MTWPRRRRSITIVVLALISGLQLIPLPRDNPPDGGPLVAPAGAIAALKAGGCFDCHSNETRWPWYAWVAPASFLVVSDVSQGREHMNFSTWQSLTPRRRRHRLEKIVDAITDGWMPPWQYAVIHRGAKLGNDQKSAIKAWANAELAALERAGVVTGATDDHDHDDHEH